MKKSTLKKNPTTKIIADSLVDLPTPTGINYMWNMGSMLGICMTAQIISGIVLATQYTAQIQQTFETVIHISRDTNMGFLFRFLHLNMASLFFMLIYTHMFRGMFNNSPKTKTLVWMSGVAILILLMAAAFLGYVLPWGQMSFWGATVITNIFSAVPYLGKPLVSWLWGGFSVSQPTLTRFFALHFLVPMILTMAVLIHLMLLHKPGSSNPTGTNSNLDKMKFHPYFSSKDATPVVITMIMVITMTTQTPLMMGDTENSNEANPLSTPLHIQPEWYFLFAYAILRSIPSKIGGVIALVMSLMVFLLPTMSKEKKNSKKNTPIMKSTMWTLISMLMILTWIGANPVEPPFETIGQVASIFYFTLMSLTIL